jgi:uncharacterized membrane protein
MEDAAHNLGTCHDTRFARRRAKPSRRADGTSDEPLGGKWMDCYFHHAVPSVARCPGCGKSICATCRSEAGDCPSCRLAARLDQAAAQRQGLAGGIGPSYGAGAGYEPPPQRAPQTQPPPRSGAVATVRPESRALVALGYPFWPLALIALFDPSGSDFVRRNAWQALGFNAGMYGLGWLLTALAAVPFIGLSAWPLLPFIVPVTIVASVVYAIKVWHGDDVRVPFVSDIVDQRLPTS